MIPDHAIVALKKMFGDEFNTFRQIAVTTLVTAYLEGSVTNKRLQEISQEHPSDITKLLQNFVEKGFLVTNNKTGRGTVYHLNKFYRINSVGNDVNSVGNKQELSEDERLQMITDEARHKKRLKPEKMRQIITLACTVRPLSLNTLSKLLDRNVDNLRITYISKMVDEGILHLLYPSEPNHPNQAYYSKQV